MNTTASTTASTPATPKTRKPRTKSPNLRQDQMVSTLTNLGLVNPTEMVQKIDEVRGAASKRTHDAMANVEALRMELKSARKALTAAKNDEKNLQKVYRRICASVAAGGVAAV